MLKATIAKYSEANDISRIGVLSNTGTTSKRVAEKFNFQSVQRKSLMY